ncbi:MAG: hypothetical protein AB1689_29010, partial [Thermodesulfobacteriota bacterium]
RRVAATRSSRGGAWLLLLATVLACDAPTAERGAPASPGAPAQPAADAPAATSLLELLPADGALLRADWPAGRVMTQPVALDTAPSPGFVKVRVPPHGAVLETAYGVNPERWAGLRSGPFRFAVVVLTPRESNGRGRRELVLEERIDPARGPGDRRWVEARVDLDRFAGGEILLAFMIDTPSLVDSPGDLAGWRDPRLVPRPGGPAQAGRASPDGTRRNADTPTR